jgi:hypothetical protein
VNLVTAPVVTLLDEIQDELQPIESEPVVRALANDLPRRSLADWERLRGMLNDERFRAAPTAELQDKLAHDGGMTGRKRARMTRLLWSLPSRPSSRSTKRSQRIR